MLELTAGLALFFAAHTFSMFREARAALVSRLGALPYRGLYSLVSLAGFVLIVHGYGHAPRIDVLAVLVGLLIYGGFVMGLHRVVAGVPVIAG